MTDAPAARRPIALAVLLIVGGLAGWIAAFALTLEKIAILENPDAPLACDLSILIQCGKNLGQWQGEVFFGVPNPLWGLGGFVAPIAVGVALLAGARFARWFWIAFNVGLAGALAFVIWLIGQSLFAIFTLCPWCMVVWVATIPMFWAVTLRNLSNGTIPVPEGARRFFAGAYEWVPLITLGSYLVIAILAQWRLDVLGSLF